MTDPTTPNHDQPAEGPRDDCRTPRPTPPTNGRGDAAASASREGQRASSSRSARRSRTSPRRPPRPSASSRPRPPSRRRGRRQGRAARPEGRRGDRRRQRQARREVARLGRRGPRHPLTGMTTRRRLRATRRATDDRDGDRRRRRRGRRPPADPTALTRPAAAPPTGPTLDLYFAAMSVRPIVMLGDPRLRLKGKPVDSFGKYLHELLDDLAHTMRDAPGVGLAAPQLGEALQACVIEVEGQLHELVNPQDRPRRPATTATSRAACRSRATSPT